jgi:hypothetical protein
MSTQTVPIGATITELRRRRGEAHIKAQAGDAAAARRVRDLNKEIADLEALHDADADAASVEQAQREAKIREEWCQHMRSCTDQSHEAGQKVVELAKKLNEWVKLGGPLFVQLLEANTLSRRMAEQVKPSIVTSDNVPFMLNVRLKNHLTLGGLPAQGMMDPQTPELDDFARIYVDGLAGELERYLKAEGVERPGLK